MKKGFTLVELVGALVIIGILVSMVLVATGNSRDRALQTRIAADMEGKDRLTSRYRRIASKRPGSSEGNAAPL